MLPAAVDKKKSLQQAALHVARDLAGGVTYLSRKLGIGVNSLDAMLHGREDIPEWVFLRAVDFVNEERDADFVPPGFPRNWRESNNEPSR